MKDEYILEMRRIAKIYGNGVVANSDVNFNLKEGEIHALVGENGAGKSTLMKILFGMEQPSGGEIILYGQKTILSSSKEAIARGIGMVHQHFMLVESFTVAQNVILGLEIKSGLFIDRQKTDAFTEEIGNKYHLSVNPREKTSNLSVGDKQKVELLKALARGAKILILDEPTAVLTPQETKQLFKNLKELKKKGHTIVFISHKIPEVKEISDRVTILRSGRTVGTFNMDELTESQISDRIMGNKITAAMQEESGSVAEFVSSSESLGKCMLEVNNISYTNEAGTPLVRNVSFGIKRGMIFGLAGVQGNGQVELVRMITKTFPVQKGEILFNGKNLQSASLQELRLGRFGYIPEDRLEQGVATGESIRDNLISNRLESKEFSGRVFLRKKEIDAFAAKQIRQYEIRCDGTKQLISMLSGGNMQKVVVARECSHSPEFLIAEQPTRGVDVGAASIIHKQLLHLRDQGCAILLISADLNELLKLSDVIGIFYAGELAAYFSDTGDLTEENLGLYMLGIKRHDKEQIEKARNRICV